MTELLMPSKVVDKKHICLPEGNVVESDEEWSRHGKWILCQPLADLQFLDLAWIALQQLLADDTLIMLKVSTTSMVEVGASVLCFTRPGEQEAKRAAKAIRKVFDFKGIMYYKLNEQTSRGIANRYGDKRVSIYMHTFCGAFYTKKNHRWIRDNEDDARSILAIASNFLKENYSGNENLPSTCMDNHQYKQTGGAKWYLNCSCEDEGVYLSDVDRVWLVAQKLVNEGLFVGITLIKFENAKCAKVCFHVSRYSDVHSSLPACDRIFKEASYNGVMYFENAIGEKVINHEGYEGQPHDFLYTSDGELYRSNKYGHEYINFSESSEK